MAMTELAVAGRKVALLMGGPGSENHVSMKSGESVRTALEAAGAQVVDVVVTTNDFVIPEGVDLAFNVIHGTFGEDGELQERCEAKGVAYTGAGVEASRLAFDKIASKERFVAAGVPTPAYEVLELTGSAAPTLPLPLVVKPPREGSSVGVHIVKDPLQLATAIADVAQYGSQALVEAFVPGKELTVGILDDQALPIVHICPRSGFYDMNNKYPWAGGGGGSDYYCPADLDAELTRAIQDAALAAHRCLGVEIYSRVDVLLGDDGSINVLEVNTIPGMTESSLLPKAAAAVGIDFPSLCSRIGELSLKLRKPE